MWVAANDVRKWGKCFPYYYDRSLASSSNKLMPSAPLFKGAAEKRQPEVVIFKTPITTYMPSLSTYACNLGSLTEYIAVTQYKKPKKLCW